jgi:hypothetical protein
VTYTYAIAPLALAIGAVVLDEPVTVWLVLGAALVVGGIATAQGASLRSLRRATAARRGRRQPAAVARSVGVSPRRRALRGVPPLTSTMRS